MAKRESTSCANSKAAVNDAADRARQRLAELDAGLLTLLNERAELFRQLTELHDLPTGQLFGQIEEFVKENAGPLSANAIRSIFRELMSGSRKLIAPQRVAYLGPVYSYSHIAAINRFGQDVEFIPVATIAAVFEEVERRQVDFGLVPIENSTDGRVADTLDMFTRIDVRICGEVQLRIHHNLLGRCRREEVKAVYSKPQALSQCRDWLALHLPNVRTHETTSTAAAAKHAAEKQGVAAVASLKAAANYGLDVIAGNIEDNRHNITRFAVIGHESASRTGKDKTSLMFQVLHQPGALAEAMNAIRRHELNLTWIESFPITGARNEYLFFVELEGHESEDKVQAVLEELESKTISLTVLGSYAVTEVVE
jgi:chorismate mutase/prephenate dehydratase